MLSPAGDALGEHLLRGGYKDPILKAAPAQDARAAGGEGVGGGGERQAMSKAQRWAARAAADGGGGQEEEEEEEGVWEEGARGRR